MDHDFVINEQKVENLYRSDISEFVQLLNFMGKTDPLQVRVVKMKDENILKNKIQRKIQA